MENKSAREVYADIIDLPHHQSETRPQMSLYDRAAQFSPFAALSGYDDMVREEARLTDKERELSETDADELDRKLALLADRLAEKDHPRITVVRFIPDDRKTGGRYEELSGVVKKLDLVMRCIVFYGPNGLTDGQVIDLDRIADISGELFRGMDVGPLLP